VRLASEEARGLRHTFVGTEHILLGLLGEGTGTAATVLASFGVTHDRVRAAVVRMMGVGVDEGEGEGKREGELSLTGRAQDVIDRAQREASMRDRQQVGTDHILLALIREEHAAATRIILQLDADPAAIRAALAS
jgi:ATP-dependent Clp protease ATP-binding subunit ClpC